MLEVFQATTGYIQELRHTFIFHNVETKKCRVPRKPLLTVHRLSTLTLDVTLNNKLKKKERKLQFENSIDSCTTSLHESQKLSA